MPFMQDNRYSGFSLDECVKETMAAAKNTTFWKAPYLKKIKYVICFCHYGESVPPYQLLLFSLNIITKFQHDKTFLIC